MSFLEQSHQGVLLRVAVLAFLQQLEGRLSLKRPVPLQPRTRQGYACELKLFLRWAEARGHVLEDLSSLVAVKQVQTLPRPLSEQAVLRLIEQGAVAVRERALVELFYGTGLRLSEVQHLQLCDLDLQGGLVHVRCGKGKKGRLVPLPERTAEALREYLRERPRCEGVLFLNVHGQPLQATSLAALVARCARRAGLSGSVRPHRLRHSYATHLLQHGADITALKRLLGHKSLISTQTYTAVELSDLRAMLEKSHPRERAKR